MQTPDPSDGMWAQGEELDLDDPPMEGELRALLGGDARFLPISRGWTRVRLDDRVVDVSTTGARIRGQNLPGVGKDVLLKIAGVELFGTIIRTSGNDSAMTFDRAIGPGELDRLRSVMTDQSQAPLQATIEERDAPEQEENQ